MQGTPNSCIGTVMLSNKQKAYVLCWLSGWRGAGEVVMCLLWDTQQDIGRGGGSLERGHWGSSSLLQTEGSLSDTRLGFYPWSSLKVMGSLLYHSSKHINTPLNSSLPHQRPNQEIVHIVGLGNILYIHTIFYCLADNIKLANIYILNETEWIKQKNYYI